jgi:hypothetical protein
VEHERCDACGFDGSGYDDESLLDALRGLGRRWRTLIASTGPELRRRPAAHVWSAIEYAAHSRDVTALHAFGVEQAITIDEPSYPAIEGDDLIESAASTHDGEDPEEVTGALDVHATRLARLADDAGSRAWSRGLTIGDTRSDVRRLLEHALHDSLHHLADVERGLAALRAQSS